MRSTVIDPDTVKIDLHVSIDSPMRTDVLSMDELKIEAGPLDLYLDAATVKVLYRRLRDDYHTMSTLSQLPDPLPRLD